MANRYMTLLLFGVLLALSTVRSKTIFNEHGEMIDNAEEQETQDELSEGNQDEEKRTYKPPVYYTPRYSCGNGQYSPRTEVCCCGKKYTRKYSGYGPYKRLQWKCCGYQYIDGYLNQCCPYFTVMSRKHKCPRSKV